MICFLTTKDVHPIKLTKMHKHKDRMCDMHLSSKTMNKTMQSKRKYDPGNINILKRG